MYANGLCITLNCVLYGICCLSFLVLCVWYSNGLSGFFVLYLEFSVFVLYAMILFVCMYCTYCIVLHGMGLYYIAYIVSYTAFCVRVCMVCMKLCCVCSITCYLLDCKVGFFCVQLLVGCVFHEYWDGTVLAGVVRFRIGWCCIVWSCMFCTLCMYFISSACDIGISLGTGIQLHPFLWNRPNRWVTFPPIHQHLRTAVVR